MGALFGLQTLWGKPDLFKSMHRGKKLTVLCVYSVCLNSVCIDAADADTFLD